MKMFARGSHMVCHGLRGCFRVALFYGFKNGQMSPVPRSQVFRRVNHTAHPYIQQAAHSGENISESRVLAGFAQGDMKRDISVDKFLWIISGCLHLSEQILEPVEGFLIPALGGQTSDSDFDKAATFDQIFCVALSQKESPFN